MQSKSSGMDFYEKIKSKVDLSHHNKNNHIIIIKNNLKLYLEP